MLATYCTGPVFTSAYPFTTSTVVQLIDDLNTRFGPSYTFVPEGISDGGILMTKWPGSDSAKNQKHYKSMRFQIPGSGKWPWIREDTFQRWRTEPAEVIWSPQAGQLKGNLFLKALYGAPVWTQHEIDMVVKSFETAGFQLTKTKIPRSKLEVDGRRFL